MGESTELQRAAYEATPRALDPTLQRLARGDRGCLPDFIAGSGALSMLVALVAAGLGLSSFAWAYAGAAWWVGGFFYGAWVQSKSGKVRMAALTQGPLVLGKVVKLEAHLRKPGKRAGRAVVLFTTDPTRRLDPTALDGVAKQVAEDTGVLGPGAVLLSDPDVFGVHPVGEPSDQTWVASAVLHPDRLVGRALEEDEPVVLLVDPAREVVEQAPLAPALPKSEDEDVATRGAASMRT